VTFIELLNIQVSECLFLIIKIFMVYVIDFLNINEELCIIL